MKAKKPLVVVVLTLVLLAVALILPAVASSKPAELPDNQPVNWVKAGLNSHNLALPFWHGGWQVNVQQLGDNTLRGEVILKDLLYPIVDPDSGEVTRGHFVGQTGTFVDLPIYSDSVMIWPGWPDFPGYSYPNNYAAFHKAGTPYTWPAELNGPDWGPPLLASIYGDADIADFIVYGPNETYGEPGSDPVPSYPVRFVLMDFGEPGQAALEPGKADLIQVYFWQPYPMDDPSTPGDETGPEMWVPQVWVADFPGVINPADPVFIPNGNVQVHVGETDG